MKTPNINLVTIIKSFFAKTRISFIVPLFFLALTLINCRSKEDDPVPPVIYPVEEASVQKLSSGKSFTSINAEHETGVKFSSAYKGKITKIGVNTSSVGNLEVTLWKVSDKSKIGTYMVNACLLYTSKKQI